MVAPEGTRYAALPDVNQAQGLVGELSASTNAGATYSVSAKIATASGPHAATFEMRLRNSTSGAQSPVVAHASITYTGTWKLITGTVTANAIYDRIVLRFSQQGGDDLIDDVHMCQAAQQVWVCPASASNLVLNPSFEQVINPGHSPISWEVLESATTQVPSWTATAATQAYQFVPFVVLAGMGLGPATAFEGSKYVRVVPVLPGMQEMGLLGALSAPMNVGTTYVLSARITTLSPSMETVAFELRLRNSGSGAESAPFAQALIPPPTNQWRMLTGVVATNAIYNQVVLRYHSDVAEGFIDDVHMCQAAAAPLHPAGWWSVWWHAGGVALAAMTLIGGLVLVFQWRTRVLRTKTLLGESFPDD